MRSTKRHIAGRIVVSAVACAVLAAVLIGAARGPTALRPLRTSPAVSSSGALAAASRFAIAWWTSDWREVAQTRATRLRLLLVPAEDGSLTSTRQVPVLDQAEARARRHVAVGRPSVVIADRTAQGIGVAITAPITVTTATRPPVQSRLGMEVLLVPDAGRWLVAEVDE